jgi:hypothetical protein
MSSNKMPNLPLCAWFLARQVKMHFLRHLCSQFGTVVLRNNLRTLMPLTCGMYLPDGRICLCMATLNHRQQSCLQACVHLSVSRSCRRHMPVFCVLCLCVCIDVCALKAQNLHKYTSLCSSCKHAGVKRNRWWMSLGLVLVSSVYISNRPWIPVGLCERRLLLVNIQASDRQWHELELSSVWSWRSRLLPVNNRLEAPLCTCASNCKHLCVKSRSATRECESTKRLCATRAPATREQ